MDKTVSYANWLRVRIPSHFRIFKYHILKTIKIQYSDDTGVKDRDVTFESAEKYINKKLNEIAKVESMTLIYESDSGKSVVYKVKYKNVK